jgi:hypothetical protein
LAEKVLIWKLKPLRRKKDKTADQEAIKDWLIVKCLLIIHRGLSSAI